MSRRQVDLPVGLSPYHECARGMCVSRVGGKAMLRGTRARRGCGHL